MPGCGGRAGFGHGARSEARTRAAVARGAGDRPAHVGAVASVVAGDLSCESSFWKEARARFMPPLCEADAALVVVPALRRSKRRGSPAGVAAGSWRRSPRPRPGRSWLCEGDSRSRRGCRWTGSPAAVVEPGAHRQRANQNQTIEHPMSETTSPSSLPRAVGALSLQRDRPLVGRSSRAAVNCKPNSRNLAAKKWRHPISRPAGSSLASRPSSAGITTPCSAKQDPVEVLQRKIRSDHGPASGLELAGCENC